MAGPTFRYIGVTDECVGCQRPGCVETIVVVCCLTCAHPGALPVDITDEYADEDATGMLLLIGAEDDGDVYLSVQDREPVVLTAAQAVKAGMQLLARAQSSSPAASWSVGTRPATTGARPAMVSPALCSSDTLKAP